VKPKVYLETTIPSLLTAWPSRDLIIAADQQITKRLAKACAATGFTLPVLCTPRELMAV